LPSYETDFLIIGSGIAGLIAAHRAKEYGAVLIVTKERAQDSNTGKAQGGIAAAIDEEDSPFLHLEDTLEAGAGFCDPEAVEILVTEVLPGLWNWWIWVCALTGREHVGSRAGRRSSEEENPACQRCHWLGDRQVPDQGVPV